MIEWINEYRWINTEMSNWMNEGINEQVKKNRQINDTYCKW